MLSFYNILKKHTLFYGFSTDELTESLNCLDARLKHYRKKSIIRRPDKPVTEIGIVVKGVCHVTKTDYNGNRAILDEIPVGRSFGESLAFTGMINSPISIVAATDASVIFIPLARLFGECLESCVRHDRITKNIVRLLAGKILILQMKIDILSQKTTREKLLLYLEYESKSAGSKSFKIRFTREELADFLSLNASAVSRELCKMRDEGILTFRKNRFVLVEK